MPLKALLAKSFKLQLGLEEGNQVCIRIRIQIIPQFQTTQRSACSLLAKCLFTCLFLQGTASRVAGAGFDQLGADAVSSSLSLSHKSV